MEEGLLAITDIALLCWRSQAKLSQYMFVISTVAFGLSSPLRHHVEYWHLHFAEMFCRGNRITAIRYRC
jgi:hypothetical protein